MAERVKMGLRDWYGEKGTAGQVAVIGGAFTVVGAVIAGFFTLAAAYIHPAVSASGPSHLHTLITKHTPSYSPSPTPTVSSSPTSPSQTPKPPSVDSSPSSIPVLAPKEQPGWTLDWNQQVAFQSQGIIVGHVGPETSDGSNFDIQYVPDNGWQAGGNAGELDNWPFTYAPGPATIYGYMESGQNGDTTPEGSIAHVGDTIFYIDQNNDQIGYLDVTGVSAEGVEVDMWVWTKN